MSLSELYHDIRALLEPQVQNMLLIFLISLIPAVGPIAASGYMLVMASMLVHKQSIQTFGDMPFGDAVRWGLYSIFVEIAFAALSVLIAFICVFIFYWAPATSFMLSAICSSVLIYISKWFVVRGVYLKKFGASFELVDGFSTIKSHPKRFWMTILFAVVSAIVIGLVAALMNTLLTGVSVGVSMNSLGWTQWDVWSSFHSSVSIPFDTASYMSLTGLLEHVLDSVVLIAKSIIYYMSIALFWDKTKE